MELYDYINHNKPQLPIKGGYEDGYDVIEDLYEYSPADSKLWLELMMIVDQTDSRLTDILKYLRATGAILVPDQQWGYMIQPVIDPTGQKGWQSQQQYEQERKYLVPYTKMLITALNELRRKYEHKLIV